MANGATPEHPRDVFPIQWLNPDLEASLHLNRRTIAERLPSIPRHWLPLLLPFETASPHIYYDEAAARIVHSALSRAFTGDWTRLNDMLAAFGTQLDFAYATYLRIARLADDALCREMDRETKYRQYVFPAYLDLFEGVWKLLCRALLIAIETPEKGQIEKCLAYKPNVLSDKLNKYPDTWPLFSGWNTALRNSIAHNDFEFSDDVMKDRLIVLHNPATEDMPDFEIDLHFREMLYTCSGMLFAFLRFIGSNESAISLTLLGHYLRSQIISQSIASPHVHIDSNTCATAQDGTQRNITVQYTAHCNARAIMLMFHVLKLARNFLTADRYYVVIDSKKGLPFVWINTPHDRATAFIDGTMSFEALIQTGDIQIFRPWKHLSRHSRLRHLLPFITRMIPVGFAAAADELRTQRGWSVAYDRDFSTGLCGRHEVFLYVHRQLSRDEIRQAVRKAASKKRALFRSVFLALWDMLRALVKKRVRCRPPVNVVLVHVWLKKKRQEQMCCSPTDGHPLCICCAEWNRDTDFRWLEPRPDDEVVDSIRLRWFTPPAEDISLG